MYNGKYIIPGLIVFLGLITFPFWYNLVAGAPYAKVKLPLPADQKECIEKVEFMRAEHMQILNEWRDKVVREGARIYTATNGKQWAISLQATCLKCHANKADFCDKCHLQNSVSPYCWTCHLGPKGNQ